MIIKVQDETNQRVINDLLYVYHSEDYFINAKGYLTKLIDKLDELGYYKDNESLFIRPKG